MIVFLPDTKMSGYEPLNVSIVSTSDDKMDDPNLVTGTLHNVGCCLSVTEPQIYM